MKKDFGILLAKFGSAESFPEISRRTIDTRRHMFTHQ
jgi:hypothetical protein